MRNEGEFLRTRCDHSWKRGVDLGPVTGMGHRLCIVARLCSRGLPSSRRAVETGNEIAALRLPKELLQKLPGCFFIQPTCH